MFALTRFEIRKLIAQKKAAIIGLLPVVMLNALFSLAFYLRNTRHGDRPQYRARDHLVREFINAYNYTQSILAPSVFMLLPTVLAIIGAWMVAGELESGNMRMMLLRPVGRWRVIMAKFVALSLYALVLLVALGGISYGLSCLQLPHRGLVLIPGPMYMLGDTYIHTADAAGWRILVTYALAWPMLMSVGAMSLMFGLTTRHYAAAAILTCTVYYCSYIISLTPMLVAIHPFMPTRYLPFWRFVLETDVPWRQLAAYAGWTAAYTLGFLGLGIAIFNARDV